MKPTLFWALCLALPAGAVEKPVAPLTVLPQAQILSHVQASLPVSVALPAPTAPALGTSASPAAPASGAAASDKPTAVEQVQAVSRNLEAQLKAMEVEIGGTDPILDTVRLHGQAALGEIERRVAKGHIDPSAQIRTHEDSPVLPVTKRELRIGIYPVAADPFQWGHMLIALRAMAFLQLDKVYFILAGDDPRKPNMTPVADRHPMGQAVLDTFAPLFAYSPIAVGTTLDGETNIFRTLALNPDQAIRAFYLVGADHYKLKDAKGNDDTIPKIEKKLASGTAGNNPDKHQVDVAFVRRGEEGESVPTSLTLHFFPPVEFEASSTLVRGGKHVLMPWAAYDWVRRFLPGRFGVPLTPKTP